jgi:hypothetical protein
MPTYSAVLPCTPTAFTVRPTPPVFQYSVSTPIATSSVFPADADEYYVPPDAYITVQDIITTIHSSMHTPIKTAEYRSFLEGAKENVGRCYYSRIAQLDEKASKKASKKGALRMDVLPLGYAMVSAFYMASWDPEKGESSWGIEFGPIMQREYISYVTSFLLMFLLLQCSRVPFSKVVNVFELVASYIGRLSHHTIVTSIKDFSGLLISYRWYITNG